jgi:hypothetical protein
MTRARLCFSCAMPTVPGPPASGARDAWCSANAAFPAQPPDRSGLDARFVSRAGPGPATDRRIAFMRRCRRVDHRRSELTAPFGVSGPEDAAVLDCDGNLRQRRRSRPLDHLAGASIEDGPVAGALALRSGCRHLALLVRADVRMSDDLVAGSGQQHSVHDERTAIWYVPDGCKWAAACAGTACAGTACAGTGGRGGVARAGRRGRRTGSNRCRDGDDAARGQNCASLQRIVGCRRRHGVDPFGGHVDTWTRGHVDAGTDVELVDADTSSGLRWFTGAARRTFGGTASWSPVERETVVGAMQAERFFGPRTVVAPVPPC